MYDVYSSDPKDARSYFGYQILLSSGMDAVEVSYPYWMLAAGNGMDVVNS